MSSYDEIPYTQNIYKQTQPDTLATLAILCNKTPPPVAHCRVLELGCAQGHNLIAMAQAIPQGFFTGIDAVATQIAAGNVLIAQLKLINIELKCLDLQEITSEFGTFDYIIAHGVYSWIAPTVQEKLLAICHDNLHSQGIAYISYNTYPGWQADAMLREILLFHLHDTTSPSERLEKSKQLLKSFLNSIASRYDNYALSLKNRLHYLLQLPDNYFAHEHLEEYNQAIFFHQFIQQVEQHHLHYLVDLQTYPDNSLLETNDIDFVTQQQHQDFLVNRRYRETLLCRNETLPHLPLNFLKIKELYLSAALQTSVTRAQIMTEGEVQFENLNGKVVAVVSLLVLKLVCYHLGIIYPKILSFKEFQDELQACYQIEMSDEDETELLRFLCDLFIAKDLELYTYPPHFCTTVSSHPVASPMARLQCQSTAAVTNLRYETFELDETTRLLLPLLDGKHNYQQLLLNLNNLLSDNILNLAQLKQKLEYVARKAFLMG